MRYEAINSYEPLDLSASSLRLDQMRPITEIDYGYYVDLARAGRARIMLQGVRAVGNRISRLFA